VDTDFDAIGDAYSDAHEFLHDCADAYFEPARFRRRGLLHDPVTGWVCSQAA